jgi:hypothetical protein
MQFSRRGNFYGFGRKLKERMPEKENPTGFGADGA